MERQLSEHPFTYKLLWDIQHWLTPLPKPPNVCTCLICGLKRLGIWFIITSATDLIRVAHHQYRVSRGREDCACTRPHRIGRSRCLLSEGYAIPNDIRPESFKLCRLCSNLATSKSDTDAIASDGSVVETSKRCIERAAFDGCPLCRIILDHLIDKHDAFFRSLWRLPFCGKIILGFRAAPGPARVYSHEDRQTFDTMEVSLLSAVKRSNCWIKDDMAYEGERLARFAVAADQGDPAAEDFPSRLPIPDVSSDMAMAQAAEWIQECSKFHETCVPKPENGLLPNRLVDVDTVDDLNKMKLVSSEGQTGEYAALSYCWGQKDQPVMTKNQNFNDFLDEGLPVDELPQTIIDAVRVTRRLGIRYLWVDVLCIIQDSREDKDREIGRLQDYFANAYVTIIAANAPSCHSGFLKPRNNPRAKFESLMSPDRAPPAFKLPWLCNDGRTGSIWMQPWKEYDYMKEAVNSRAWTLEERLLSPRMLAYTSTQLIWMCQTGIKTPEVNVSGFKDRGFGRLPDKAFIAGTKRETATEEEIADMFRVWRIVVEDYTARTLTDPADKLRAISGIAARMKASSSDMTYLAGIWHSRNHSQTGIAAELMWRIPDERKIVIQTENEAIRLPSFTWSSVREPVTWDMPYKFRQFICPASCVQVLDIHCEFRKQHQQFGFIAKAMLFLRGPTKDDVGLRCFGSTFYVVPHVGEFSGDLDTTIPDDTEEREISYNGQVWRHTVPIHRTETAVRLLRLHESGGLILKSFSDRQHYRIGTFQLATEARGKIGEEQRDNWLNSFTYEITRLV